MKLILTIHFLILIHCSAKACECIKEESLKKDIKNSDLLVTGEIISIQYALTQDISTKADTISSVKKRVLLVVREALKGAKTGDTITIFTGKGGTSCGFNFVHGKLFTVFAHKNSSVRHKECNPFRLEDIRLQHEPWQTNKNTYYTSICTRTSEFQPEIFMDIKKVFKNVNKHRE